MSETTDRDIEALRENIEETRGRISGEIEAIGDRLTPGHAREVARGKVMDAKDKAVSRVKTSARSAYDAASRRSERLPPVVRDNPVPIAMLTVGAGWLAVSAIRSARQRRSEPQLELELEPTTYERVGDTTYERVEDTGHDRLGETRHRLSSMAEGARGKVSSAAERARSRFSSARESTKSRVSGTVSSVKGRAGSVATRGREKASVAWDRSHGVYDNNPLVIGGVCVLAGIGLGLLLPHTERENRVLGSRREQIVDRAKHMASDAKNVAIDSAKEGLRAARETAKHETEERNISIG